ncbi:VWA domain-containing protein [Streptomyces niveus]|uniref:VWA domain-containing protein n=1 Tax=Streptomyces niveus TaxID=193462 RepID=UPI00364C0673
MFPLTRIRKARPRSVPPQPARDAYSPQAGTAGAVRADPRTARLEPAPAAQQPGRTDTDHPGEPLEPRVTGPKKLESAPQGPPRRRTATNPLNIRARTTNRPTLPGGRRQPAPQCRDKGYQGALGALALAAALSILAFFAGPAAAEPDQRTPAPRVETVLDVSGSMSENDAGGQTRLAAAKNAVNRLLDSTPEGTVMGVRVYGSTYAGTDPGPGCNDTRLLAPVEAMDAADREDAKSAVRDLKAVGMTPIGRSLKAAAADLGDSGPRRIILISDGEETCAPPGPCDVARKLKGAGIELVVDTVGFRVGAQARSELRCIAAATKGTYVDADDADELADRINESVKRALTPYTANGKPVRGADDCAQAPRIAAGQYLDQIAYGQQRWYKVRLQPGQALRFSGGVIVGSAYENPAVVKVEAYLPGEETRWAHAVSIDNEWSHIQPVGIRTDRLTWDQIPAGEQSANVCTVVENRVRATATSHPVEIAVEVEGQAVSADGQTSPVQPPGTADPAPTPAVAADDMSSVLDGPAALAGAVLLGVLAGLGIRAVSNRSGFRR